ncbi:Tol biopolymer transport system periplasmic protein [Planoprotostelium fungivorum]|uniref:Tol biopolymer transport system periplasmic protein n=1 Tax=Planoprotostelium fungivorum TaxID=1890364 RepID=A0A2P6N4G6_9EUKA|nr:Tol biopolymer transport system periplasmic protein [Planoprotostelium fungivorum]
MLPLLLICLIVPPALSIGTFSDHVRIKVSNSSCITAASNGTVYIDRCEGLPSIWEQYELNSNEASFVSGYASWLSLKQSGEALSQLSQSSDVIWTLEKMDDRVQLVQKSTGRTLSATNNILFGVEDGKTASSFTIQKLGLRKKKPLQEGQYLKSVMFRAHTSSILTISGSDVIQTQGSDDYSVFDVYSVPDDFTKVYLITAAATYLNVLEGKLTHTSSHISATWKLKTEKGKTDIYHTSSVRWVSANKNQLDVKMSPNSWEWEKFDLIPVPRQPLPKYQGTFIGAGLLTSWSGSYIGLQSDEIQFEQVQEKEKAIAWDVFTHGFVRPDGVTTAPLQYYFRHPKSLKYLSVEDNQLVLSRHVTPKSRWLLSSTNLLSHPASKSFLSASQNRSIRLVKKGSDWEQWKIRSVPSENLHVETNTWTSFLEDDALVTSLSIPGTHESYSLLGGHYLEDAKCQTMKPAEQLMQGVRMLHVNLREVKGQLYVYHHQGVYQRATVDHVLFDIKDFLSKFHREFVLLRIEEEHEADGPSSRFTSLLQTALKDFPPLCPFTSLDGVRVRDVRGRVVLLSSSNLNLGVKLPGKIVEQRSTEMKESEAVEHRWEAVRKSFSDTKDIEDTLHLNYVSAYRVNALDIIEDGPASFAEDLLGRTDTYVRETRAKTVGVVVMDFARTTTNEGIIRLNFGM